MLTAWPERYEVAHYSAADNADVVLVVLEVRPRLDLSHQAEQGVHQRNGVMGCPGLPVVAVPRFVRLLVLLDAESRTVKDRGEDKRDRVKRLANEAKELVVEKHVEATRRFLPFANATEICASAICGRREAVILELSYYGVRYYLRETPISLPPHNLIHLEGEQT